MALTQISTDGIKNGTITGSDLATNLDLVDNQKIRFGTGNDLQIYHDGTNSFIVNNDGDLLIRNTTGNEIKIQAVSGEQSIQCIGDGAVELYHNGSKKFETTSTGVEITGGLTASGNSTFNADVFFTGANSKTITFDQSEGHIAHLDNAKAKFGTQGDLSIYHDGSNSYIQEEGTGNLYIDSNQLYLRNADTDNVLLQTTSAGAVQIKHNGNKKFETTSNGCRLDDSVRLSLGTSDDFQLDHDGTDNRILNQNNKDFVIFFKC